MNLAIDADAVDPQAAGVFHLFAADLSLFAHLSFADGRIGDLPDVAAIIHERRFSAFFCAVKVATGLVCILLHALLVANGASHFTLLVLVTGKKERSRRKNKSHYANYSFHLFISPLK